MFQIMRTFPIYCAPYSTSKNGGVVYSCACGEFPDASRDGQSTAVRVDESGGRDWGECYRGPRTLCAVVCFCLACALNWRGHTIQ